VGGKVTRQPTSNQHSKFGGLWSHITSVAVLKFADFPPETPLSKKASKKWKSVVYSEDPYLCLAPALGARRAIQRRGSKVKMSRGLICGRRADAFMRVEGLHCSHGVELGEYSVCHAWGNEQHSEPTCSCCMELHWGNCRNKGDQRTQCPWCSGLEFLW
jgi:hypothetical protein